MFSVSRCPSASNTRGICHRLGALSTVVGGCTLGRLGALSTVVGGCTVRQAGGPQYCGGWVYVRQAGGPHVRQAGVWWVGVR